MTLKVGDHVLIGSHAKPAVLPGSSKGILIDIKWNLGLVKFPDGATEWIDLRRIYKATQ